MLGSRCSETAELGTRGDRRASRPGNSHFLGCSNGSLETESHSPPRILPAKLVMHKTSDTLDGDSGLDTRALFSLCKPTQVIAKELLYTTDHKRQADRRLPVLGGGKWPGRPELAGAVPEERGGQWSGGQAWLSARGPQAWHSGVHHPEGRVRATCLRKQRGLQARLEEPRAPKVTSPRMSARPSLLDSCAGLPGDRDMPCQHVHVSPGSRRSWCSRSASGWRKR